MSYIFCNCKSLTYLNLSNFNTQNVIIMNDMFVNCISLKKNNLITQNDRILKVKDEY